MLLEANDEKKTPSIHLPMHSKKFKEASTYRNKQEKRYPKNKGVRNLHKIKKKVGITPICLLYLKNKEFIQHTDFEMVSKRVWKLQKKMEVEGQYNVYIPSI